MKETCGNILRKQKIRLEQDKERAEAVIGPQEQKVKERRDTMPQCRVGGILSRRGGRKAGTEEQEGTV